MLRRPRNSKLLTVFAALAVIDASTYVPCTGSSAGLDERECAAWQDIFDAWNGDRWGNESASVSRGTWGWRLDPCSFSAGVTCVEGHITEM